MSTTDWTIIEACDLIGEKESGDFIRAYCHIHGGDHQRSLAINKATGFGQCYNCDAHVLVREFNPKAAERIERSQANIEAGEIKVRDPKYIKATQHPTKHLNLEGWQKAELQMLQHVQVGMERLLQKDERPSAYIAARGLSLESAKAYHVGYIPATLLPKYKAIEKWRDHIVFPVHHPEYGLQFVGRNLHLWQPGMDENEHKALLETLEQEGMRRWRKTHACGWFNFNVMEAARHLTFVEGAFDALALIEAGNLNTIAVIGTSLSVEWVPKQVEHITLAFDSDESGVVKAENARQDLYIKGYEVVTSSPPADGMGKDWSERYRLHGVFGLVSLCRYVISTCICPVVYLDATGGWWCEEHQYIANYERSDESDTCSLCPCTEVVDVDDEGRPYCMLHRPVLEVVAV